MNSSAGFAAVAQALNAAGLVTLQLDLLTPTKAGIPTNQLDAHQED